MNGNWQISNQQSNKVPRLTSGWQWLFQFHGRTSPSLSVPAGQREIYTIARKWQFKIGLFQCNDINQIGWLFCALPRRHWDLSESPQHDSLLQTHKRHKGIFQEVDLSNQHVWCLCVTGQFFHELILQLLGQRERGRVGKDEMKSAKENVRRHWNNEDKRRRSHAQKLLIPF